MWYNNSLAVLTGGVRDSYERTKVDKRLIEMDKIIHLYKTTKTPYRLNINYFNPVWFDVLRTIRLINLTRQLF